MKRLAALAILLIFAITPIVNACMSPADSYAVEVVLNKPGVAYDVGRLDQAQNVAFEDGTYLYRSHHDPRLYVMVWNASDGPHVRVQIPVEWREESVSVASLNVSIIVTNETLKKLRSDGWNVVNNATFERNGVKIALSPVKGSECTSDADCATGGCSGEVCAPKEEASKIVTPCVYREWYSCLGMTGCGCVNGMCTWKPNPAFEACLRDHGIDPARVIRAGYFEMRVEAINESDDEVNAAVRDFLGAFGISCNAPLTLVKTSVSRLSPEVEPSEVNASEALLAELRWLMDNGVVNLSDSDLEAIAGVAEWGYSGHNSHIGWYETENGGHAWIPYHKSKNPRLVKCFSRTFPTYEIPNGTAYFEANTSTTVNTLTGLTVCGPGLVVLALLLVPLIRRR
ncbi:hypothetical protein A3L11_02360 [Thermococcus siculi]|uniref:Eight-cysteine-cluster domain-containing protein n=1 Tax=Thermococcus siculi TaxID=72803 RepID=A0A2Z2MW51_9EURY|nr:CGP-CTERM-anchored Cys-rich protein [Thermococcus siculi]ASJ08130.1 hypothetical protein A3L11_02360 [Thermococcus siculi]